MKKRDNHRLEGLLKARSQDLRQRRTAHLRGATVDPRRERPATGGDERGDPPAARRCADCGGEISPARMRAMPGATRCLTCQRAFERDPARA